MRGSPSDEAERDRQPLTHGEESIEELSGKLASNPDEQRLMRSVLENEDEAVKDGKVIAEAVNQGVGSFTPDLFFKNLVQNYQAAKKLYGETLIRALTEYTPDYVQRNLSIPEFRDGLLQRIEENVESMKKKGLLDKDGFLTERGMKLAALVLYTEELDTLVSKGLGRKELREKDVYGEKENVIPYRKGGRFKDVAMKQSLKTALRRGHTELELRDLKAYERSHKGRIQVIYAMDSSGSMRGQKISMSKRAGIALCYKAIEEKNNVGLIVFTSKVEQAIAPTQDFKALLMELTRIRAGRETNLARTLQHAIGMFTKERCTKHLLILTDALPTKGKDPRKETLEAASLARDAGITISIVGISLDSEGEKLARDIVEIGQGRLYRVKNIADLDAVILEDYDALSES